MIARAAVVAASLLALLVAAPAGGAADGRLFVDPAHPVVGVRVVVELEAKARAPLFAQLVSPTGVLTKTRLTRVAPGLWRTAVHFPDDGQWIVRVDRARVLAKVLVLQNPAALPPFRPNQAGGSKASSLSGVVTPGIVVGR